jgi:hypothetical protein
MTRYVPSPSGGFGCRFCRAMRELLMFTWKDDVPRFKRLWDSGGCSATFVGATYLLIERGEDESLYQIDPREVGHDLAKRIGPTWIRNDMMHAIEEASP